jgi:hypothetical protein|tara:strand:- start:505 stop:672 length:168 start_codon:yes stop_codon:yes gene_type:complete
MKDFRIEFGVIQEDGFGDFFSTEAVDYAEAIEHFKETFPTQWYENTTVHNIEVVE